MGYQSCPSGIDAIHFDVKETFQCWGLELALVEQDVIIFSLGSLPVSKCLWFQHSGSSSRVLACGSSSHLFQTMLRMLSAYIYCEVNTAIVVYAGSQSFY